MDETTEERKKRTALGRDAFVAFCEALGIDPHNTRRVDMAIHFDDFAVVTYEQLLTEGQMDGIRDVLVKYKLADQLEKEKPHRHTHNGFDYCEDKDYGSCDGCHCHLQDEAHTACCKGEAARILYANRQQYIQRKARVEPPNT